MDGWGSHDYGDKMAVVSRSYDDADPLPAGSEKIK